MADQDNVSRAITNYTLILVMTTEIVAGVNVGVNPTQDAIEDLVAAATRVGIPTPKPDSSIDGKSYSWSSYQEMIGRQLEQLQKVRAMLAGPYEVRSQAI